MKKTTLSLALLAVGALAVTVLSTKSTASPATCAMPSCCGGAVELTTIADAKVTSDQLATCPVSGEKLGEMGKPFTFTYNPEKYISKIRAADKK